MPARSLERALRAGARTIAGSSRRLHGGFVVSEIALAVVLLVAAGMLGRTLLRLSSLDPGVNIHNVLTARMSLSPATLADPGGSARPGTMSSIARRVPACRLSHGRHRPDARGQQPARLSRPRPLRSADNATADRARQQRDARLSRGDGHPAAPGALPRPIRTAWATSRWSWIDEVLAQHAFGGQEPSGSASGRLGSIPSASWASSATSAIGDSPATIRRQVRAQFYYPFAQVPDRLLRAGPS